MSFNSGGVDPFHKVKTIPPGPNRCVAIAIPSISQWCVDNPLGVARDTIIRFDKNLKNERTTDRYDVAKVACRL